MKDKVKNLKNILQKIKKTDNDTIINILLTICIILFVLLIIVEIIIKVNLEEMGDCITINGDYYCRQIIRPKNSTLVTI